MKILLTSDWDTDAVNGVVTSLCCLRRALEAQGHSVRLLTLSGTVHTVRRPGVLAIGSLNAGLIYPGARLGSPVVGSAVRELIAWHPDVVHSQCEFSTFPLARHIARACGAPLVHTYHTVYEDYTHYFSPSRRWGRWLARSFTRRVAARTDLLIAPTQKVCDLLRGYRVGAPVRVLPTGIELAPFRALQPAAAQDALRTALGIPAGNKVLVFVGRLAKEKNIDELLACRAALGGAPVTLLLVGDGPDRPRLEQCAAALGLAAPAVVFAGMAPPAAVAGYYRLGDVFVSASQSETQGLTYIEALASGLPLVCRADPCLAGVVQDGRNGWQYRTAAGLQGRVTALLQSEALRAAMGRRSAELAEDFSAESFGRAAAELYRAAILQKQAAGARYTVGRELQWRRA